MKKEYNPEAINTEAIDEAKTAAPIEDETLDVADRVEAQPDETAQPRLDDNLPTRMQLASAFSLLMRNELLSAEENYAPYFYSSKEAMGAIREEYLEVEELLRAIKISAGEAKTANSIELLPQLLVELVQLSTMGLKAALSLCDLRPAADQLNQLMKQSSAMAEMMAADEASADQAATEEETQS